MPHWFLGNSSNIYDASSYWQRSMACRPRSRITEIVVGLIILTFGVSTNQGVAPIRKADTASTASAFYILCSSLYPLRSPNYTACVPSHTPLIAGSLLGRWGHSAKWSNLHKGKLRGIRVDASELYYWLYLFEDKWWPEYAQRNLRISTSRRFLFIAKEENRNFVYTNVLFVAHPLLRL